MVTHESDGNSSRLSLDVANLPMLPFGMKLQGSPRKLTALTKNRISKLSRRKCRLLQEGREVAESQTQDREIIDSSDGGQHKQRCPGNSSAGPLHTLPEGDSSPEHSTHSSDKQVYQQVKKSQTSKTPRAPTSPLMRERGTHNVKNDPIKMGSWRDSIYTDIDDGSFIEFCDGKEGGHHVPCITEDMEGNIPVQYYTCESGCNDTEYSTSTKTNNALVGFRKYLDKIRQEKGLRKVCEEREVEKEEEEFRICDRVNEAIYDETIITCSADICRLLPKGPAPEAVNSTVIDNRLISGKRPLFPHVFSEISTLTVESASHEVISGSESSNFTTPAVSPDHQQGNRCNISHETVIILESSNEEDLPHPTDGVRDATVDIGDRGQAGISVPPSPKKPAITTAPGNGMSLVSEDVTIIDSTFAVHVQTPVRPNIPSPKPFIPSSSNIGILTNNGARMPLACGDKNGKSCVSGGGVAHDTQTGSSATVKGTDKHTPENYQNPSVQRWIMVSPFKDGSFDSSFLQRSDNSFISETPSWPKMSYRNKPVQGRKLSSKHLTDLYDVRQRRSSPHLVKKSHKLPHAENSSHDSYDSKSSGCEFTAQPTDKAQRVIVSSSEESDDYRTSGMYVTQRRGKKHTKKSCLASLEKHSIIASDNEEEEEYSLHLRLSESQTRTNAPSEKTIQTIGRVAITVDTSLKSPVQATDSLEHNQYGRRADSDHDNLDTNKDLAGSPPLFSDTLPKNLKTCLSNTAKSPPLKSSPDILDPGCVRDSDGPLDLSLIRKELDSLYSSDWRKNEDAILKSIPKKNKQQQASRENKSQPRYTLECDGKEKIKARTEKKKTRFSRVTDDESSEENKCRREDKTKPRYNLETDNKSSKEVNRRRIEYKKEPRYDVTDDESNEEGNRCKTEDKLKQRYNLVTDDESDVEENRCRTDDKPKMRYDLLTDDEEENRCRIEEKAKQKYNLGTDSECSKEEYGHGVKTKTKPKQNLKINDDSKEEGDSFLYHVSETSGEDEDGTDTDDAKGESDSEDEKHKCNGNSDRKSDRPNHSGWRTMHTPPRHHSESPEEDSFEEYLQRIRTQRQEKKKHKEAEQTYEDEDKYESSFINSSSSDDSFTLPPVLGKPRGPTTTQRCTDTRHIGSNIKGDTRTGKLGRVTATTTTPTAWRDSPTITITSDSDEIYSLTTTKKLPTKLHSNHVTLKTQGRGRVFPKTEGHRRQITKRYDADFNISPRLSFLASLSSNVSSVQCHPEALTYVKNFKKKKEELTEKLYKYYNIHVFDGRLPATMSVKWNARLTKTAGYCYYQIDKSKESGRGSRIELSIKVIDCSERLRDTLIHELCHAAAWIISGYKDGHGPLWKAWAAKATFVFPELPSISRCHSYKIQCKYTYRCTRCSYSIGRHSKSLDTEKKVCGYCYGKFELIVNSKAKRGLDAATPKTPGAFAIFVKENYSSVKKATPYLKHGDVMKTLSAKFGEMKTKGD